MTRDELAGSISAAFHNAHDRGTALIENDAARLSMTLATLRSMFRNDRDDEGFRCNVLDTIDTLEDLIVKLHSESETRVDVVATRKAILAPALAVFDSALTSQTSAAKRQAELEKAVRARDVEIRMLQANVRGASAARKSAMDQLSELTTRTSIHPEIRERVWSMTDGRCYYCDTELVRCAIELMTEDVRRVFHVDHLVPKSCGGPDHISNYVPSCGPCNLAKSDKSYTEFIRDRHPRLRLVASR